MAPEYPPCGMSGHMKRSEIKKRSKAAPEALAIARADLQRELEAFSTHLR